MNEKYFNTSITLVWVIILSMLGTFLIFNHIEMDEEIEPYHADTNQAIYTNEEYEITPLNVFNENNTETQYLSEEDYQEFPVYNRFTTINYRGASLSWEGDIWKDNIIQRERIEVFHQVVDSLTDVVPWKYSINNVPMHVYCLSEQSFNYDSPKKLYVYIGYATLFGGEIFLSPLAVNSSQIMLLNIVRGESPFGPHQSFEDSQLISSSRFARLLVHEYMHVLQGLFPEELERYALKVGWELTEEGRFEEPEDSWVFYKVMRDYSLKNPLEDMADTIAYSYICDYDLYSLSAERLEYIDEFWGRPREEYCQNFD